MRDQTGSRLSRRALLGGLIGSAASAALADAPLHSPRPPLRGGAAVSAPAVMRPTVAEAPALIDAAKLGGRVGYVVLDARTGTRLEAFEPDQPMPPASVAKTVTSLYAVEHLGRGYRFPTRLIATGPIQGGRIAGDLILAGGGDPTLTTDTLGDMAAALRRKGVTGITGRFLYWGGALPYDRAIDQSQPDYIGYNPAVSGLNLNFNRVYFEWKRGAQGYDLSMDARAERFVPKVYTSRISVAARDLPVYTYSDRGAVEEWTVASAALGKAGGRWLPVRRPDLYAADVFQTLARAQGIPLPTPEATDRPPAGTAIVEVASDDLSIVLRDMLKYSTNITAEVVGMSASARRGPLAAHHDSGPEMTDWLKGKINAPSARFVDHSGLGGASRISAADMAAVLAQLGPQAGLRGLLKDIPLQDEKGKKLPPGAVSVQAKTGTLNFVSSLAGYITAAGGSELIFAIFTGDVARRDAVPDAQKEQPQGGADWVRRSKRLQQQLIQRWGTVYGA